jgi:large subunit ribosomal protein L3
MPKFILGRKIGMTQIYKDDKVVPITVVEAGPSIVTNILDSKKNGYISVQLSFGQKRKIKKSVYGQVRKLGNFAVLREFRLPEDAVNLNSGVLIKADVFNQGDIVNVSGCSKGKGFQGVVKRHGFKTWPRTHGHPHQRQPGSIGSMSPPRVVKGKKMAGRMGAARVTVKNLEVIEVDSQNNLIALKGAVPGRKGTILEIREAELTRLGKIRKLAKK